MIGISLSLERYSEIARGVWELKDYSENPNEFRRKFGGDFEDFEFMKMLAEEKMINLKSIGFIFYPRHYRSLFEHLDEVLDSIKNPFSEHPYWQKEAIMR